MARRDLTVIGVVLAMLFGIRVSIPTTTSGLDRRTANGEVAAPAAPAKKAAAKKPSPPNKKTLAARICAYTNEETCRVWAIITPIADPARTSLGLLVDRELASIHLAAAEHSYFRYAQELPWASSDTGNAEDTTNAGLGFILFRRSNPAAYLALLLVPELPSRGVDERLFQVALATAGQLQEHIPSGRRDTAFIMGPEFSASGDLVHRYADANSLKPYPPLKRLKAISGTITAASDFRVDASADLQTTQVGDNDILGRFVRVLHDEYEFNYNQIAIVSEADTVYGAQELKDVRQYHFPANLSQLRNAYAPVLRQLGPQSGQGATQPMLPDVVEPSRPFSREEMPSYAGKQAPVIQEAQLYGLANTMKADRVRIAGILATDSLDTLFLLQFFRRAMPDTLLFVRDPDLLFVHASEAFALRGVLAIGSFGLFDRGEVWLPKVGRHLNVFSSSYEAGDFYAFSELLWDIDGFTPDNPAYPSVTKLWPGFAAATVPPMWLMAIGVNGYEPLAIVNQPWSDGQTEDAKLKNAAYGIRYIDPGKPPRSVIIVWLLLALAGLLHLLALASAEVHRPFVPAWLMRDFRCTSAVPDTFAAGKAMCHAIALMVLAFALLVLGSVFIYFRKCDSYTFLSAITAILLPGGPPAYVTLVLPTEPIVLPEYSILASITVILTVLLVTSSLYAFLKYCVLAAAAAKHGGAADMVGAQERQHASMLPWAEVLKNGAGGLLALIVPMTVWCLSAYSYRYELLPLHIRDLNVVSGVAPIVPMLLLLGTIYAGAWTYLRRVSYHDWRCAPVPPLELDSLGGNDASSAARDIEGALLKTPRGTVWVPLIIAVFMTVFVPWRMLVGFEPYFVRAITLALFFLAATVLLMYWVRLLTVWSRLQAILNGLAQSPLLEAFGRIPGMKPLRIWSWDARRAPYLPLRETLDTIRDLRDKGAAVAEFEKHATALETELRRVSTKAFAAAAGGATTVTTASETARWSGETLLRAVAAEDLVIEDLSPALKKSWDPGSSDGGEAPADLSHEARKLAEDLIAFRFYVYIRYVVTEIRNLIFFIALAFTLLAVAISSYAFHGAQTTAWMLVALFLLLAAGIVIVFAQMDRDAVLSKLEGGNAGELGKGFYWDIVRYGAVPLLTLLASIFPSMSGFVLRFVQPSLDLLK